MTQRDEPTPETNAWFGVTDEYEPRSDDESGINLCRALERDRNRLQAQLAGVVEQCYQAAYDAMTHGTMNYKALDAIRSLHPDIATEEQVALAAQILADSPLIDEPKLPAQAWYGLARHILDAARQAGSKGGKDD